VTDRAAVRGQFHHAVQSGGHEVTAIDTGSGIAFSAGFEHMFTLECPASI
jgi:hypothetical protein